MARIKNFLPRGSDDPQSVALRGLDHEQPSTDRRPAVTTQQHRFGPPPGVGERTWKLARLFLEVAESYQRHRVVYDQELARMLGPKIKSDPPVVKFITTYGPDWADDILARMIRIYWRDYVAQNWSNSQIIRGYLDDHWGELFELAKTQYATDEFQRRAAAGELKTKPHQGFGVSLQYDDEYQEAISEIRVQAGLRRQLGLEQLEPLESGNDGAES